MLRLTLSGILATMSIAIFVHLLLRRYSPTASEVQQIPPGRSGLSVGLALGIWMLMQTDLLHLPFWMFQVGTAVVVVVLWRISIWKLRAKAPAGQHSSP